MKRRSRSFTGAWRAKLIAPAWFVSGLGAFAACASTQSEGVGTTASRDMAADAGAESGSPASCSPFPQLVSWDPATASSLLSVSPLFLSDTVQQQRGSARTTVSRCAGKWYWEIEIQEYAGATLPYPSYPMIGVGDANAPLSGLYVGNTADSWSYYPPNAEKYNDSADGNYGPYGTAAGVGDVIGVALDIDDGTLTFYKNGVSLGVAFTNIPSGVPLYPMVGTAELYFGATARFSPPFAYPAPAGYAAFGGVPDPRNRHHQGPSVAVPTQHNDNARTGANLSETTLAPGSSTNVSQQQFGYLYRLPVTGSVQAQPLIATNVTIGGTTYPSVLYVATMHNMVYAYDASSPTPGSPLLIAKLEHPTPANDPLLGSCGGQYNVLGETGIASTPVIAGGYIYVVTNTNDASAFAPDQVNKHWIHKLDITTLTDATPPVLVTHPDGTTFNSVMEVQRPALVAVPQTNQVYAAFASYCDNGNFQGWVLGFDMDSLAPKSEWNDAPEGNGAGIWQSGQGPAADDEGNLYLLTGNATCNHGCTNGRGTNAAAGGANFTEAMVRLGPNLGADFDPTDTSSWFIPSNYKVLDAHDLDFSAGGALLLPSDVVIGGGKFSTIYVTNQRYLGGFGDQNTYQALVVNELNVNPNFTNADLTGGNSPEIHGSPVYYDDSQAGPHIYVWPTNDNLKGYLWQPTSNTFDTDPSALMRAGTYSVGSPGAMLSVSANGSDSGATGGIVWAARWVCETTNPQKTNPPTNPPLEPKPNAPAPTPIGLGRLMAFDATNLNLLWDSAANAAWPAAPTFRSSRNAPPTIANGNVFLSTYTDLASGGGLTDQAYVMVYGLMPLLPSSYSFTPANDAQVASSSSTGGGLAASRQFGLDQTDVFSIDQNGELNVAWVTGGGAWNGPAEFTNNANGNNVPVQFPPGAPVAASNQFGLEDNTDVLAVNVNGTLDVAWVNSVNPWNGPAPIGNPGIFKPGSNLAVSNQTGCGGQTDVFIVDSNGDLTVTYTDNGGGWQTAVITRGGLFPPGAPLAASPQFGLNQTDVFLVDKTGTLDVVYNPQGDSCTPSGPWNGPARIGNEPRSFPQGAYVAASQQFGVGAGSQTDVFAVDITGTLQVGWSLNGGAFNLGPMISDGSDGLNPGQILGAQAFPPGAPLTASQQFGLDQTDVFIVRAGTPSTPTGSLSVMWVDGANSWHGPATLGTGGPFPQGASVAASPQFGLSAQTDVFVIDANGNRTVTWTTPTGFTGPSEIPSDSSLSPASQSAGVCPPTGSRVRVR